MTAADPHGGHPKHHHLHTPPSSPPSTRRRHRKKPDLFEELATTPIPSAPGSPADALDDSKEPLLTRIILTPVLFTSFLLSLFLVNYRNRVRRAQAHASSSSLLAYLVPSRWLDPEPYQDPDDSTWTRRDAAPHVEPHDAISQQPDAQGDEKKKKKEEEEKRPAKKRSSWHLNKKIRKVAKLEIGDALEMRGRMIVAMTAFMILACAACWVGLKWCFTSMSHALSASQA